MKHLSEQDVFDCIDDPSGAPARDAALHAAECDACRMRIAMYRQIRVSAARVDTHIVSKNFTKHVMSALGVPKPAPRLSWLSENGANIFAMVFAVGIAGCAVYVALNGSPDAGDSVYARQYSVWRDAYQSVMQVFAARNREVFLPVVSETKGVFNNVFLIGAAALVLLGSLDKLRSLSRVFRAR